MWSNKLKSLVPGVMALVLGIFLLTGSALADAASHADASPAEDDSTAEASPGDDASDGGEEPPPPPTMAASGPSAALSKLSVHGFLTQAYADANFAERPVVPTPGGPLPVGLSPTGFEAAIGIPEDGTTNYRFLALQFRYDISPKDVFTVQLSSRALGFSPNTKAEDEIEIDWAFYERRLTDHTSLKIGRVQIPMGLFNEVRDVGTILPFYRPAFNFYREGAFTSETVDGLSLTHEFLPGNDWGLEVSAYAGEWELIAVSPNDPESVPTITRATDGYGYQIWVVTPLPELRFGTGLNSYESESEGGFVPLDRTDIFHASMEGIFGRFTIRAEWQTTDLLFAGFLPGTNLAIDFNAWYVQAGYQVTEKFSIWAQREEDTIDQSCACFLIDPPERDNFPETAVALNYAFQPNIVLKGEYHWTEAIAAIPSLDFSTGRPHS